MAPSYDQVVFVLKVTLNIGLQHPSGRFKVAIHQNFEGLHSLDDGCTRSAHQLIDSTAAIIINLYIPFAICQVFTRRYLRTLLIRQKT